MLKLFIWGYSFLYIYLLPRVADFYYSWLSRWQHISSMPLVSLPAPKVFKPKHDLPVLDDYRGAAPPSFWAKFPRNYVQPAVSLIDGVKLRVLALEAGFADLATLDKVCEDLEFGAVIGCSGPFRGPSTASNAPGAYEEGEKVTDAIADWLVKGFCFGPVPLCDIPGSAKISGMMTRPKPNGSVRIIQNLSAPKGFSVNDGINSDDFPTKMSSTTFWLRVLNRVGRGAWFIKVDWSDAYKHIAVALQDTDLQWFRWLDMGFKELCLIFGGASSAGIFDRVAKIVIFIATFRAMFPREWVIQHLDDCCAAAPGGSLELLQKLDREFFGVAEHLGIKLAPRDDPDKSFGPSTSGTVLGVFYDTVAWTWHIKGEKLLRLLHQIQDVLESDEVRQDALWSLTGKILHVKPLIPTGRFNLEYLIRANSFSQDRAAMVPISRQLKRQLWFWFTMLRVCDGPVSIPNPDEHMPPWTVEVYSDAAGGTWRQKGHGVGAVGPGWWAYLAWSRAINHGRVTGNGRHLDRLMSALELLGPLLAICAAPVFCRGKPVRVWVDNSGSVYIWKKGYSPVCPVASTVVKATASVAAALGCRFEVEEITRCSTPEADMADALSKAAFVRFWNIAAINGIVLPFLPLPVPLALVAWLEDCLPDDDLGDRLVKALERSGAILGVRS